MAKAHTQSTSPAGKSSSVRPTKITSFRDMLDYAEPRPDPTASPTDKKNYAQTLSTAGAMLFANSLRSKFDGILPDENGKGQESKAGSSKGFKKLDVNYSTIEIGLGLGISIKTCNFRDNKSNRYTKNYTRVDNELRAEAMDYHVRQPWAVMVCVFYLPYDACTDGNDGSGESYSSFGGAVKTLRHRAGRRKFNDEAELFEGVFIGLYEHQGVRRGDVIYFDVEDAPPRRGPPKNAMNFDQLLARIIKLYDMRNDPPFVWADGK